MPATSRIAPNELHSHNLFGIILTEAHQPRTGEFHYHRVQELSGGRDPVLLANLALLRAVLHGHTGDHAAALACWRA